MEHMKELIAVQKPILLDGGNFGHWKVRIRHVIRAIDKEAWAAVVNGWKEPTMVNGNKSLPCFSDTESEDEEDNKDLLLNFGHYWEQRTHHQIWNHLMMMGKKLMSRRNIGICMINGSNSAMRTFKS